MNIPVEIKQQIIDLANRYHTVDFVKNDPIQVPTKYRCDLTKYSDDSQADLEISSFITALLSFGRRDQIIKHAWLMDSYFDAHGGPYRFVMSKAYGLYFQPGEACSFYRTISCSALFKVFEWLHDTYNRYGSMEKALQDAACQSFGLSPIERLICYYGVRPNCVQKRLNMFLRWMIRRDSAVDFGLWLSFSPKDLHIPLDTHVAQTSMEWGITTSTHATWTNEKLITEAMRQIFPDDPCFGDFALFGYGVNKRL